MLFDTEGKMPHFVSEKVENCGCAAFVGFCMVLVIIGVLYYIFVQGGLK